MKKIFLIALVLFSSLKSFADEEKTKLSFSLEPQLSFSFEKHGEYLLYDSKEPASYLEWKLFPIVRSGIKSGLEINRFVMEFELATAIPLSYGKMYDSDWNENGLKYIYSENDAKMLSDFSGQLELSYTFPFTKFALSPVLCLRYSTHSFKAFNGHGWYGIKNYSKNGQDVSWDDENAKYYPHIGGYSTYLVSSFYSFIGCNALLNISTKSALSFSVYFSPYSYIYTNDYHYKKSGQISKYAYAQQNAFFSRFMEEISFTSQIFHDLFFVTKISSIQGWKSYGNYVFYQQSPLYSDTFYCSDKGISASDIITATISFGVNKMF